MTKRSRARGSPEARLSLRAGFCMTSVLVIGLWPAARSDSTVLALGALWAIGQDGLDQWRVRGARLLSVALAAVVGIGAGTSFVVLFPQKGAVLVLYGVAAFAAGVVEGSNFPSAGSYLVIGAVVGGGVGFAGHQVTATLLIGVGALWVYLIALVMDRRNARTNQRLVLAQAFRSVADLFDAIGQANFTRVRSSAVTALDAAQDVIGSDNDPRAMQDVIPEPDDELFALRQCLVVALQCGEVVSLVVGQGLSPDPTIAPALRDLATRLAERNALDAAQRIRELRRDVEVTGDVSAAWRAALRAPDVSTLRQRTPFVSQRQLLPRSDRLRFAALLTLAVEIAAALSLFRGGTHSFWLPLAVAYILRPDLGSVVGRALARTVGTVVGTLIAVAAVALGNPVAVLIGLSIVMAAAVPWAARRSHTLTVIAFTPIVFVLVGALRPERSLFLSRVIDTAVAAVIVLGIDYLMWSRAPSLRPRQQVDRAQQMAMIYRREATVDDVLRRHRLRRDALRAVAGARGTLTLAASEHHARRRDESARLKFELDRIESDIDATTMTLLSS
ncbi:MAG TPA: FUSC family protein [Acidimicrobiales bacterium]|nr:FUSC family protein [Acidimicrobiales bacterium]